MLDHSTEIGSLAVALAAAQAKFDKVVKGTTNTFFKSKYATLADVVDATRKGLAESKIAVVQEVSFAEALCSVTTMLFHESGQWMKGTIAVPVGKLDPQGVGSASTYARRYGLSAFVNVAADDDDDGNAASKPVQNQTTGVGPEELKAKGDHIAKAESIEAAKVAFRDAFKWAGKDTEAQKYLTAIWEGQKAKFSNMPPLGVVQSRMEEAKEAANVAK